MGYDICLVDNKGNYRYIEVKVWVKFGVIVFIFNEWVMVNWLGEEYWFYIVENVVSKFVFYLI